MLAHLVEAVLGPDGGVSERAFTIVAFVASTWCGVSLWRWQRDGPTRPSAGAQ